MSEPVTWKAARITADAANKLQINAGILVKKFNVTEPTAPLDEDILFETTGDFSIVSQPQTSNFFENINNAPLNIKEGLRIDGWTNTLSITALSITLPSLKLALGAADYTTGSTTGDPYARNDRGGARGRMTFDFATNGDFQTLTWLGDMAADEGKLFAVVLENAVSTGGIQFTATDRGKGGIALTFTAYAALNNPDSVPMAFYILDKQ